jgi:hypothetical protein
VGPLGGLALSIVRPAAPMMIVRAVRWYRDLARLGLHLPLFVVHDLGLLYAAPREQLELGARPKIAELIARDPRLADLQRTYAEVVGEISQSEASARARSMRLSDDLVVVILARVLGSVVPRVGRPPYAATIPLDPELVRDLDPQLPQLWASMQRGFEGATLEALARARLHVLTLADALDLDTLRLLGMLGPESGAAGALAHVDLLSALNSPGGERHRELLAGAAPQRARDAPHEVHRHAGRTRLRGPRDEGLARLARAHRARVGRGRVRAADDRERDPLLYARAGARRRRAACTTW